MANLNEKRIRRMYRKKPSFGPASSVRHICPETGELLWTESVSGSPTMPSVMKATEDHRHEATAVSPQSGSQFPGGNLVEGDSFTPIDIYTDGSCLGNPGPGGWAFVVFENGKIVFENRGNDPDTTNNRMEMIAIIEALKWLNPNQHATIHSDSKLAVKLFNRTWKPKLNLDLVEIGRTLLDRCGAQLVWIKGHSGHPGNDRADALAGM